MKIPAKTTYALKALLALSQHWPKQEPLSMNAIAQAQEIPLKFLTQILLNLKSLGLVESMRGKQGGYLLKKGPAQISLSHVLGFLVQTQKKRRASVIDEILQEIDNTLLEKLKNINFEDILTKERNSVQAPMYTI
jgi:Rrf2 family protein